MSKQNIKIKIFGIDTTEKIEGSGQNDRIKEMSRTFHYQKVT